MISVRDLSPELKEAGAALGLFVRAGADLALDPAFFSAPWERLGNIAANPDQRAGLVAALGRLLPPAPGTAGASPLRTLHPLLSSDGPGQIFLVVEREGSSPEGPVALGLTARVAKGAISASCSMRLLSSTAGSLRIDAATRQHPLQVDVLAPLDGRRLVASVQLVAPPEQHESRISVRLEGGPGEPLVFDPVDGGGAGPLLAALLQAALGQLPAGASGALAAVAEHLPALLGLAGGVPAFPFGTLDEDPQALRAWLGALWRSPARQRWVDAVAGLLAASAGAAPLTGLRDAHELRWDLGAGAWLSLIAGLRDDAATNGPALVVRCTLGLAAAGAGAAVRADAALVSVPLQGGGPPAVLEQLELSIGSPAGGGELLPASAGGSVAVGSVRGGLRRNAGADPRPFLELVDVSWTAEGRTLRFPRLDLADARSLSETAGPVLREALETGLGAGTAIADALRTLAGLGAAPTIDLGHLASAPREALAAYYRALGDAPGGWGPLLQAIAVLLGTAAPEVHPPSGEEPWRVALTAFAAPAALPLSLELLLWDHGAGARPRLRLGLGVRRAGAGDLDVRARLELVAIDLDGSAPSRWLSGGTAAVAWTPSPPAAEADLGVGADRVRLSARWALGAPLAVEARLEGAVVRLPGPDAQELRLPALTLPLRADLEDPALGLGADAAVVWSMARAAISLAASSWGGVGARTVLGLLGVVAPGTPGIPDDAPRLELPEGGLRAALERPDELLRAQLRALLGPAACDAAGTPHLRAALEALRSVLRFEEPPVAGRPGAPPGLGTGTAADPWSTPLHAPGDAPVELLCWADPEGPPLQWLRGALEGLDGASAPRILDVAAALAGAIPHLGAALRLRDRSAAAAALARLAEHLAGSDGIVAAEAVAAVPPGWALGAPVAASHLALPADPDAVAQVRAFVTSATEGLADEQWAALLLAPAVAGAGCWEPLLEGVPPEHRARIDLGGPGQSPLHASLHATESARWYVVDLGDDGTGSFDAAVAALGQVAKAVQRARPGARLLLIGHSFLGLVANAWAGASKASAGRTLGVVTMGTPYRVDGVRVLEDGAVADALRLVQAIVPDGLAAGSAALDGALSELSRVLDGWEASLGDPPRKVSLALEAFARAGDPPPFSAAVRGLAIAGRVDAELLPALAASLRLALGAAAGARPPSALRWGTRLGLGLPPPLEGEPAVDAAIELALGAVSFDADVVVPAALRPATFRVAVSRPEGWLVRDGAGSAAEVRIRAVELVGRLECGPFGPSLSCDVLFHDAAVRGAASPVVSLDDPRAPVLLDALIRHLHAQRKDGGRLAVVLELLEVLGLVRQAPGVPAAFVADAIAALRSNALAHLAPRLRAVLEAGRGLLGLVPDAVGIQKQGGPWRLSFAPLPVALVVERDPWRIGVHTTAPGFALGGGGTLTFQGRVPLAAGPPDLRGALAWGSVRIGRDAPDGPVVLDAPELGAPIALGGARRGEATALARAFPQLLGSALLTVLVEQALGGDLRLRAPLGFLRAPGAWLTGPDALGDEAGALRAASVDELLAAVAACAGLPVVPEGPLALPGGLVLGAEALAGGGARLRLRAPAPIALEVAGATASLRLDAWLDVDRARGIAPGGRLELGIPVPGGTFERVTLVMGASPAGLCVALRLGEAEVTLLPSVGGVEALVGEAASRLLPRVLDALVTALSGRGGSLVPAVLAVAEALGVRGPAGAAEKSFDACRERLVELSTVQGGLAMIAERAQALAPAIAALAGPLAGAGAKVTGAAGKVAVELGAAAALRLEADLAATPAALTVTATGLRLGCAGADLDLSLRARRSRASLSAGATVLAGFGPTWSPRLTASLDPTADDPLTVRLRLIEQGDVGITLAPRASRLSAAALRTLAETWAAPLGGALLLRATEGIHGTALWKGSPKRIRDLLVEAGVASGDAGQRLAIRPRLPSPEDLLRGALAVFAGAEVPLTDGIALRIVESGGRVGVLLRGERKLDVGPLEAVLRLGLPRDWEDLVGWDERGRGVGLLILDLSKPPLAVSPALRLGGLGVAVSRKGGPLVGLGGFRLGSLSAAASLDVELSGPAAFTAPGGAFGAVTLEDLALPIAPGDASNPIAASLMASRDQGDRTPPGAPVSVLVATRPGATLVRFADVKQRPVTFRQSRLRVPVGRSFGPLSISDVTFSQPGEGDPAVEVAIDGGVATSGLSVALEDLSVRIPLDAPADLGRWGLDLAGLGVSFKNSAISIEGALEKAQSQGRISYRGMLGATVAGRGLSAIGSYDRVVDEKGGFTSLFGFVTLSSPLGGPPYFFVLGLSGGFGYNRRFLIPTDPQVVRTHPLVAAMSPGSKSPGALLKGIDDELPATRGSMWLAAGVRFSTFALLESKVLAVVSMSAGLEVALLGLMGLRFPRDEGTLVSVELALKSSYSVRTQTFLAQGALTSNSWLIRPSCRLTGGFAFAAWLGGPPGEEGKPQALLTIGGYHPEFKPQRYHPTVPRVAYDWAVKLPAGIPGAIAVKGQTYFALTHSAMMFGGRIEASYSAGGKFSIKVWFAAGYDALFQWDPLHYECAIAIRVGAQFTAKVKFIWKVSATVRVSLGASLALEGPPLHATVRVDLAVASVTVEFGELKVPDNLDWVGFRRRYLDGEKPGVPDPAGAIAVSAASPGAKGAPPPGGDQTLGDGTGEHPFRVGIEFAFRVESLMPLAARRVQRSSMPHCQPVGLQAPFLEPPAFGGDVRPLRAALVVDVEVDHGTGWRPLEGSALDVLEYTELAASYPSAVWGEVPGRPDPQRRAGEPLPNGPMLRALSGLACTVPLVVVDANPLGDVRVASLIDEPPVRTIALPLKRPALRRAPSPEVEREPERIDAPAAPWEPYVTVSLPSPWVARDAADLVRRRARARMAERGGSVPLEAGGAQVWRVDRTRGHVLHSPSGEGGAELRMVALSEAGATLLDGAVRRGGVSVPAPSSRVVVLERSPEGVAGWGSSTQLLQVGTALVGPGVIVRLPHPWSPPWRYRSRREAATWVPGHEVAARCDRIRTELPLSAVVPDVVVVRLDRRRDAARWCEVSVKTDGGRLGEPTVVESGERIEATFPVVALADGARALTVTVQHGGGFWLEGVHAFSAAASTPTRRARELQRGAPAPLSTPAAVTRVSLRSTGSTP